MKNLIAASIASLALVAVPARRPSPMFPCPADFSTCNTPPAAGRTRLISSSILPAPGSSPGGTYAFAFNWDSNVTPAPNPRRRAVQH